MREIPEARVNVAISLREIFLALDNLIERTPGRFLSWNDAHTLREMAQKIERKNPTSSESVFQKSAESLQ